MDGFTAFPKTPARPTKASIGTYRRFSAPATCVAR